MRMRHFMRIPISMIIYEGKFNGYVQILQMQI